MLILPTKGKWFNILHSTHTRNQRKERLLNAAGNIYGTLPL